MNAKTLNLYPIDYPFETLSSRMNDDNPKLILDPDFQRKYKWDKDGWERASKFIESCLMRIPLPSCYFAENETGKHFVIDGVQRLTTIKRFFNDEFALEGLTTFKELENKKFSELGDFQSELEATTIRCIILRKENPKHLVREIFSRLNQGAVELSDQEIRHAIYPGSFDNLLIELAKKPIIKNFGVGPSSQKKKDSREAEEQVLRFFAFEKDIEEYDGTLKKHLDNYMAKMEDLPKNEIEKFRSRFNEALEKCVAVFGDTVFRDPSKTRSRQGMVHYDLLMHSLVHLDLALLVEKADNIKQAYKELCQSSKFKKTVSGGLQMKSSINKRRVQWKSLLDKSINGK
ncbi:DUF262 domain-containing protein [uncultured Desulfobacter sp.]|uniref:DUF262 domain-containing protein n=1 Tax=uncultured Desulfobacter sp. TaxID=240139 RepID=UPI002AA88FD8|nr:DUF262 domain-containing protein [uncultured Desulfobacter sp.]